MWRRHDDSGRFRLADLAVEIGNLARLRVNSLLQVFQSRKR